MTPPEPKSASLLLSWYAVHGAKNDEPVSDRFGGTRNTLSPKLLIPPSNEPLPTAK